MGLILVVDEVPDALQTMRARHDWTARRGTPPHVTIVGGTHHIGPTDEQLLEHGEAIQRALAPFGPLVLRFQRVLRYQEALVLPVEDAAHVRSITEAVCRACGVEPRAHFHITVARGDDELLDRLEPDAADLVPFVSTSTRITLGGGDHGESRTWQLGAAAEQ